MTDLPRGDIEALASLTPGFAGALRRCEIINGVPVVYEKIGDSIGARLLSELVESRSPQHRTYRADDLDSFLAYVQKHGDGELTETWIATDGGTALKVETVLEDALEVLIDAVRDGLDVRGDVFLGTWHPHG